MKRLAFHRLAATEYRQARSWYAERNSAVASHFVDAVNAAVERVGADPMSHPIETKHFRWVRVRRFPYRLIFELSGDSSILIVAVAHISRRSSYWSRRH